MLGLALPIVSGAVAAQQGAGVVTADVIMARVAANQDGSEAAREHYVYVQHARVISRKGETTMCEEITDYRVTPSSSGSTRELLKLEGRMLADKKYVAYTALPVKSDRMTPVANESKSVSISIGDKGFGPRPG